MTDGQSAARQPRASGAARVSGPMQARFRDWVLAHRQFAFTPRAVQLGLPCSTGQAHQLLTWAVKRQVISRVGPLLTGKQGRPAVVYAYRVRADEPPARATTPAMNGSAQRRLQRAGVTAPTGRRLASGSREVRDLVVQLEREGWQVQRRRKHYLARPPGGGRGVTIPLSPSDHRALANVRAQLRRAAGVGV